MERHKGGDENVASSLSIFLEVGKRERGGGVDECVTTNLGYVHAPLYHEFQFEFHVFCINKTLLH